MRLLSICVLWPDQKAKAAFYFFDLLDQSILQVLFIVYHLTAQEHIEEFYE